MKKVAVLLILFGSGLAAFGITGFSGEIITNTRGEAFGQPDKLEGSLDWSMDERIVIVVGVLSLAGGLILRKDSK
ncbi:MULTISPECIES: hypothetical protein [Acidobacteriaceae]|uniref:hypothetical protein n=1 Tax=Acidobacteriaceae TaxID=204434 RepID=UPI00131E4501|nr:MULTISPECIES: hypothetical protein [Acidobacteriaceae]MDW5265736.1 hypothetical protein [Edaphobacter sp.]